MQIKPIESNYAPSSQSISSRRPSAPKSASRICAETDPEQPLQVETPPKSDLRLTSRRASLDAELVSQPQFQLRAKRPRSSSSTISDIRDRQSKRTRFTILRNPCSLKMRSSRKRIRSLERRNNQENANQLRIPSSKESMGNLGKVRFSLSISV